MIWRGNVLIGLREEKKLCNNLDYSIYLYILSSISSFYSFFIPDFLLRSFFSSFPLFLDLFSLFTTFLPYILLLHKLCILIRLSFLALLLPSFLPVLASLLPSLLPSFLPFLLTSFLLFFLPKILPFFPL